MSKSTILSHQHIAAGAKMVDFHGWFMPLHYGSQLEEHHHVRRDAGMFDVSHMNIVDILGTGGRAFLRYLLANDIDRVQQNKALYSCMLNDQGGVIDDLIAYYRGPDSYRLVLNAATREKDLAWLQQQAEGFAVAFQARPELAMIAVQGPHAIDKVKTILHPVLMDAVSTLRSFEACEHDGWFIARTGYTGEDGVEMIIPAEQAAEVWNKLLAAGVHPCGLGARDTLRLEAGLSLYGQEMDENISPLEANLAWTIAWEPMDREFIGRTALELQKRDGIKQKLVGLILEEGGVLRHGQKIIVPDIGEGIITSGTFSPTIGKSIALARVPMATGANCFAEIRNKLLATRVVKPRFVRLGQIVIGE